MASNALDVEKSFGALKKALGDGMASPTGEPTRRTDRPNTGRTTPVMTGATATRGIPKAMTKKSAIGDVRTAKYSGKAHINDKPGRFKPGKSPAQVMKTGGR